MPAHTPLYARPLVGLLLTGAIIMQGCGGGSSSAGGGSAPPPSSHSSSSSSSSTSSPSSSSSSSYAVGSPCYGTYLLCDDFDGEAIDTNTWIAANTKIGNRYPVNGANVTLTTLDDKGTSVSVVKAAIRGDRHEGAKREGGLLVSQNPYGGGRYEVRMKPLPGPHGCSCIWSYYDSDNIPPVANPRIYTEIDIEMPANLRTPPAWDEHRHIVGLNTWSKTDRDQDATYINHTSTINPFDGEFHVFRIDWHDGSNGVTRIDWYIDDQLQASTTEHVSDHPAQLWVGNWPAPWAGMNYDFDTHHLYIDWVRISAHP